MGLRDVLTKTMFPRLQRYLLPFALTAGCGNSTSETTTPSSYVHYEKKTSDAQGQATFGGGAAVQVRDEAGKALENITVHYLSKGERNTFIAVDPQGKYFPERIAARGRASRIRQQLYRRSPLDKLEEMVLELVCEAFPICDTVETITSVLEEAGQYQQGDVLGEDENVNKYCQTREQILTNTIDVPAGIIILPATAAGYPAEKIKNSATTKLKNLAEKYILARYGDQPGYEVWVPKRAMSICGKEYDEAICDLSDGQLGQLWNADLPYWQIVGGCQPQKTGTGNDGGTSALCAGSVNNLLELCREFYERDTLDCHPTGVPSQEAYDLALQTVCIEEKIDFLDEHCKRLQCAEKLNCDEFNQCIIDTQG